MPIPEKEIWKPIKGFEGYYEVSNIGRIKALERQTFVLRKGKYSNSFFRTDPELILKTGKHRKGYVQIFLCSNSIKKTIKVHRLVAVAFIPNPENKPQINHKSGIKTDNRVENLEWCTQSENMKHAFKIGLKKAIPKFGESNPSSKFTKEQVIEIRKLYVKNVCGYKQLAKKFQCSPSTIREIIFNEIWTHI